MEPEPELSWSSDVEEPNVPIRYLSGRVEYLPDRFFKKARDRELREAGVGIEINEHSV